MSWTPPTPLPLHRADDVASVARRMVAFPPSNTSEVPIEKHRRPPHPNIIVRKPSSILPALSSPPASPSSPAASMPLVFPRLDERDNEDKENGAANRSLSREYEEGVHQSGLVEVGARRRAGSVAFATFLSMSNNRGVYWLRMHILTRGANRAPSR